MRVVARLRDHPAAGVDDAWNSKISLPRPEVSSSISPVAHVHATHKCTGRWRWADSALWGQVCASAGQHRANWTFHRAACRSSSPSSNRMQSPSRKWEYPDISLLQSQQKNAPQVHVTLWQPSDCARKQCSVAEAAHKKSCALCWITIKLVQTVVLVRRGSTHRQTHLLDGHAARRALLGGPLQQHQPIRNTLQSSLRYHTLMLSRWRGHDL